MNRAPALSVLEAARGQVSTADASEYEEARAVYNGLIDRRSLAILRAVGAGTDEVIEVGVLLAGPTDFAEFNDLGALVPRGPSRTLRHRARRRASRPAHLDPDDGVRRGRRVVPCS